VSDPKAELCQRISRDHLYPVHVSALLGISSATAVELSERGRGAIPTHIAERIPALVELLDELHRRHPEDLRLWLLRPNPAAQGRRPIDVLIASDYRSETVLELD
jgi:hypothetical protein